MGNSCILYLISDPQAVSVHFKGGVIHDENAKWNRRIGDITRYIVLIAMSLLVLTPILWMLSTVFKAEAETYSTTPIWIPTTISLESFKKFAGIYNFGQMTLNSLISCSFAMLICVACSCLADCPILLSIDKVPPDQFFRGTCHCIGCDKCCLQHMDDDLIFQKYPYLVR